MGSNKQVRRTTLQRVDNLETVLDQLLAAIQDHRVFDRLQAVEDAQRAHAWFLAGAIESGQTLSQHWDHVNERLGHVDARSGDNRLRLNELAGRTAALELPPWTRWWRRFRESFREWRATWLA